MFDDSLPSAAGRLRDRLQELQQRIVLVESCTAGRVSATLAAWPGISQWLCGSLVVYRNDSKARWLGIPDDLLDNPTIGPVSAECSQLLATAALERTPEANWAVAVTGDVGPGAAQKTDGKVFIAARSRDSSTFHQTQVDLTSPAPTDATDVAGRVRRLDEATLHVLQFAYTMLG